MYSTSTTITQNVLLVKTDLGFGNLAKHTLTDAGYNLVTLTEAEQTLAQVEVLKPVMVIFDYTFMGQEALDLSRQLRYLSYCFPILILVGQANLTMRIACLESGADDYLLKPIYIKELQQILKIYLHPAVNSNEQLKFAELSLDLATRRLFRDGEAIDLTMKEFELLKYLMSHPQEVLSREQILENVWGYDFEGESNVIEVYIRYLRLKIEQKGKKRLIYTVRGVGYVLKE